jgi:hypothetical protein
MIPSCNSVFFLRLEQVELDLGSQDGGRGVTGSDDRDRGDSRRLGQDVPGGGICLTLYTSSVCTQYTISRVCDGAS